MGSTMTVLALDVISGLCNMGWWLAGGVVFTQYYWMAAGNGSPGGWQIDSYRK